MKNLNRYLFEDSHNFMMINRLFGMFTEDDAINEKHLFLCRFNKIPHWIKLHQVDSRKSKEWLLANYHGQLVDQHTIKRNYNRNNKGVIELDDCYYFLFEDLLVYFNTNQQECTLLYRDTDSAVVDEMAEKIMSFKAKKKRRNSKPEIFVLQNTSRGLDTAPLDIKGAKLSIEENYNDDFQVVNQEILKRLSHKKDKGIVLLHGRPGTGKTSYLRYLIGKVRKKILFLPPNLAANITNPDLMNILLDNPDSIFVIEDAENLVMDRNQTGSSAVSALLNIADGLLSDCLNIQILCSFNTDLSKVDKALMRKGRLIARYEFGALSADKAQALSDKLGNDTVITRPMTLADIYNQDNLTFEQPERVRIGFYG